MHPFSKGDGVWDPKIILIVQQHMGSLQLLSEFQQYNSIVGVSRQPVWEPRESFKFDIHELKEFNEPIPKNFYYCLGTMGNSSMIVSYEGLNDVPNESIINPPIIFLEVSILELWIAIVHPIFPLLHS